ncbi:EAL domain-containing protein [Xenophilus arseniciresistens]|uniref:EAL domain-containing protein n=1 Tax=Xenophilus arseniciresistens TaxID=1283306 RepID=A0AAE3T0F4_9BURK|nr:EAL domain-containing protein [Xenophilus arseniciresistens]MDA7418157.1 EAL domain-containing protein [Xenophilus arseniciresistens]
MTAKRAARHSVVTVYVVALAFIAAVLVTATLMGLESRRAALADNQSQAERYLAGAEAALNRSLLSIDMLVAGMGTLLQGSTSAQLAQQAQDPQLTLLIQRAASQNVGVRYLAYLDPQLRVLNSSHRRGAELDLKLPEDFARRLSQSPNSTLVVSGPATSALTTQRVLFFGRKQGLADQSHALVVVEVGMDSFSTILNQGADIRGLEVTLEADKGPLLTSLPPRDDLVGKVIEPRLSEAGSDGVARELPARLSGATGLVMARPTLQRNLIIAASIPRTSMLQEWRRERNLVMAVAGAFVVMILAAAAFVHLQLRRQQRDRTELLRAKSQLDQALESMVDGFVLLDAQNKVLAWNNRFVDLFPWTRAVIGVGVPFRELLDLTFKELKEGGVAVAQEDDWLAMSPADLAQSRAEHDLTLPGGQSIHLVRSPTPDGGTVCVFQDITEKRQNLADIVHGKAQLQATLDALPDQMLEVGLDGHCFLSHIPRHAISALQLAQPLGRTLTELLPAEAANEVMAAVRDAYISGHSRGRQFERRAAQGTSWFEISVSRKPVGEGADARFIVILRNISEAKSATREIEHLAFYDTLTTLPNRRLLLHRLQVCIDNNARHSRQGALLFLDLDDFKRVNDAYGQTVGDEMLRQVALRLQQVVGEKGTLARLAGDEFVIMLENLSHDHALALVQTRAVADHVLSRIAEPFTLTRATHHSTCSIGACLFGGEQRSLEDLLKQADIAMYYAKDAGGNEVRFFEPAMKTTVTARATLDSELHEALKHNQFVLHYQPQVNGQGQVVGAEALIRWQHPVRGLLPPAGFIEVAEQTGLIVPIGLWALEEACRQLDRWSRDARYADLILSVNVSARQFRRHDFAEEVRNVLIRTGANPTRLKLELTESLLHDKVNETISKMKSLAAIGIQFSMDDFGTGFSSLSYMAQLPLNQLKIDKFFVHCIGINAKVELIIQTIIGMARNLDLEVVAEGVETGAQLAFLQTHGCNLCQGYLFGKPMTLPHFEAQFERRLASIR